MSSSSSAGSVVKSSSWSRGALAAAIALPSLAVAAAAALYVQYTREKDVASAAGGASKKKKTLRKKKQTTKTTTDGAASAAGSSAASSAAAGAASGATLAAALASASAQSSANPGMQDDFASAHAFVLALHADVELRSAGRPNARLEARIWRNIRRLTGASVLSLERTARTEIAQWIVAFHANASPLMDGGGTSPVGGPAGSGATKYHRVALDYDLAWDLLSSVEVEIANTPSGEKTDEDEELRKTTELVMLDLAHKMRRASRILELYAKVRARNTTVDPKTGRMDAQQYTEMEFFTLWMLSPLLGRWGDFAAWSSFMVDKGQSLDEFHYLATQRPDLIDFRQMYRLVAKAAVEGKVPKMVMDATQEPAAADTTATTTATDAAAAPAAATDAPSSSDAAVADADSSASATTATAADVPATSSSSSCPSSPSASSTSSRQLQWYEPSGDELEWGMWDIVGTVWQFRSSSGSDSDAIGKYVASRAPEGEWKRIAPGAVGFRKIGACCRVQSGISIAVPICGPMVHQPADPARGFMKAQMFHAEGAVNFRADAQPYTDSEVQGGAAAAGGKKEQRLLRLVETYRDFVLLSEEEVQSTLKQFRPAVVKREKEKAAAEAEAAPAPPADADADASASTSASVESTGAEVAASAADAATVDAAAAVAPSSADAPSSLPVTPAPLDEADQPLTLDEYDPDSPPQVWRGVYIFEQYNVDEQVEVDERTGRVSGTKHVPDDHPFMHVEYDVLLKMTRSMVQASALQ